MNKLYLIIIISLIISSCGINKPLAERNLYDTKWTLKTISGLSEIENSAFSSAGLYFTKNDSTYSGSNGCNMIRGKFNITDNVIAFSEGISTKRACSGIDEQKFHSVLRSSNNIRIKNGVLILYRDKTKLAEFEHND